MRHEITVLLYNIPCLTKTDVLDLLEQAECHIDAFFELTMMADYIRIEFTRYSDSQDAALIDVLEDLEFMGIRQLLRTIELEVYK